MSRRNLIMITAKSVKELREMTGAGMMDCKKALVETEGNIEKAVEFLRERGLAAAAKKAGRVAAEGIVKTFVSADKKTAAMVEVNCETDFVAANEEFVSFAKEIYASYGHLTGDELERINHQETPWIEARGDCKPWENCSNEIAEESMKKFYRKMMV